MGGHLKLRLQTLWNTMLSIGDKYKINIGDKYKINIGDKYKINIGDNYKINIFYILKVL